jgi:hypothetical protein
LTTKLTLLGRLLFFLWRVQVDEALAWLETYRKAVKKTDKLDDLIAYLTRQHAYILNYKARRAQRQYIGSAHVEKANDLIVARQQKHQGMHRGQDASDALAALRTLLLNGACIGKTVRFSRWLSRVHPNIRHPSALAR